MQKKYLQILGMLKEAIAENQKLREEIARMQPPENMLIAPPNMAQIMEASRERNRQ